MENSLPRVWEISLQ